MAAYVPPWLEVTPQTWLDAMKSGAQLGLSRAEMEQQAREKQQELALQQSRIGQAGALQGERIGAQNERADAANALREAAMRQQGLLGSERIQNTQDAASARDALEQAKQSGPRILRGPGGSVLQIDPTTGAVKQLQAGMPAKAAPDDFIGFEKTDPTSGLKMSEKIGRQDYQAYQSALNDWNKKKAGAVVPGRLWGTNPDPNFEANNPQPQLSDFIGKTEASTLPAAAALMQRGQPFNFGPSVASPSGTSGAVKPKIPQAAIDYLKKNPDSWDQFDAQFGQGTSDLYLGNPAGTAAATQ